MQTNYFIEMFVGEMLRYNDGIGHGSALGYDASTEHDSSFAEVSALPKFRTVRRHADAWASRTESIDSSEKRHRHALMHVRLDQAIAQSAHRHARARRLFCQTE